jgi:methylated-DNA-protein-cysteine methyltransferase-like protein
MVKDSGRYEVEGFFERVYLVVKRIPHGRVTSYGAIAAYLGSPGAARMVGWAMNQSHTYPDFIPAHRVVNRNGLLTGKHHFPGHTLMQELLENEGAVIEGNRILNFGDIFWDPVRELGL